MSETDPWTSNQAVPSSVPALRALDNTSQMTFESLMGQAAVVEGYALADKADLINVAFIITGITYRYARKDDGAPVDYVSLECVTKDNAAIVINDGSTGIRRQVTQYLMAAGAIEDGDPDTALSIDPEIPVEFDLVNGDIAPLRAPRGLRVSDYDHPEYGKSTTYYLG